MFIRTSRTGKIEKAKKLFRIPEFKNPTERERAQQWLPNVAVEQDMKTFKFVENSALYEYHFHWRPATLLKRDSSICVFFCDRSSHPEVFNKIGVLKDYAKFTEEAIAPQEKTSSLQLRTIVSSLNFS